MNKNYKSTRYACYLGYITQAIVNNLAPLLFVIFQDEFNISIEMIGRLILFNFVTQIVVDALAVKYVDKIGYRKSAVLAHIFSALGLISLGVLPNLVGSPYIGLVISVMLYAIGGGLIEVIISPIIESIPSERKEAAMSLLHSFYCWGQMGVVLISTLLIKIFGSSFWWILPIIWSFIPAYNIFNFSKVPLVTELSHEEKVPLRKLLQSGTFRVALLLMVCAGASELAMSQWASFFAEKGLKVSKIMGDILGPSLFALFMGLGRLYYGIKENTIHLKKALMLSSALCIACYITAALVMNPVIALLGCALTGLSVSLMWPGMLSLSTSYFPKGGTAMFGFLAIFGDVGCALGPWIAGAISQFSQKSPAIIRKGMEYGLDSEQTGLKIGLLAALIFPIGLFIGVSALKKPVNLKKTV